MLCLKKVCRLPYLFTQESGNHQIYNLSPIAEWFAEKAVNDTRNQWERPVMRKQNPSIVIDTGAFCLP